MTHTKTAGEDQREEENTSHIFDIVQGSNLKIQYVVVRVTKAFE